MRLYLIASKLFLTAGLLITLISSSSAALAPNYERARELTEVINRVAEELPQQLITKVIYQQQDRYQIITSKCSVRATIVNRPDKPGFVGPRQFDVKLGQIRCKK